MREIELNLDLDQIRVPIEKVAAAVGYLATWGLWGYPRCTISYNHRYENDLHAHYVRDLNETFTICAVWDEACGEYTFHS